jgi:asparagine synthase (glutamine-hydrolysing)
VERDLADSLRQQTLVHSLPVLLRYEDRNSMAWSIESRVPFLDYRLVEFVAGLPDELRLRHGRSKVVLREALRGVIPAGVAARRDKMGFVTPEEVWLRETATDWFRRGIDAALAVTPEFYDVARVRAVVEDMIAGRVPFSFLPWRILCLGRWMAVVRAGSAPSVGALAAHGGP